LAKLCKKKQSILSMARTRGTIGYIAPEVFSRIFGGVSHKSDVYSYGMSRVVEMLEGSLESIQIPPKPFLFILVSVRQQLSASGNAEISSSIEEHQS
ncbi:hypothetical protein F511_23108, partial [Dorcoceras hygrometricum]